MSVIVEVDVTDVDHMLTEIEERLNDPDPLLRFLADEISDYESEVFATQGFGTWGALDADTVRAKGSGRVLIDNGDLLDSLTRPNSGNVRTAGDTVTVTTDELSAVFLKRGAPGMPKRNPAPEPSPIHVQQWAEHLLGAIVEGRLAR